MIFNGFVQTDFDVFRTPGLEARMAALIEQVRPKLHWLGERLSPSLSAICGEEMFPHVAKHARRTVHPPNDTWVAWAHNKRGYKAYPHFQAGLWSTHLFIQFAVIYESGNKEVFARHLRDKLPEIRRIVPGSFFWSLDHMQPEVTLHRDMGADDYQRLIDKLLHVKKSEALCGLSISREDPVLTKPEALVSLMEQTFETLLPLYRLAF
jgi:uncharacterized protein YktB (UPF0637 family)